MKLPSPNLIGNICNCFAPHINGGAQNSQTDKEDPSNEPSSSPLLNSMDKLQQNKNRASRERALFLRKIDPTTTASSSISCVDGDLNSSINKMVNGSFAVPRSLIDEIHGFDHGSLKKVPVYYANLAVRSHYSSLALGVLGIRQHGYVMAGHPGKGRKSGAILYKAVGDPKRAGVDVDFKLIRKVRSSSRFNEFEKHVLLTLYELRGMSYSSIEEFHRAYREVRTKQESDIRKIDEEFKKLSVLIPTSKMEMWPKPANGYKSETPNNSEKDIRAFENYNPKKKIQLLAIKPVPNVRSIDLLEVNREFLLHQLYIDDRHGRRGTGMQHDVPEYDPDDNSTHPANVTIPQASAEERQRLASSTPTFKMFYPFPDETFANCNAGAAAILQRAMDRYPNEQERGRPKKVNFAGFGVGHRMKMWEPLPSSKKILR